MEPKLQHYTVTLTTEGPLFIGSGRTINKKEYILDSRTRMAYIPDMGQMMAFFRRRRLDAAYENYLLRENTDFGVWLRNNGVTERDCRPWIAYGLDSGDVDFAKSKKEIQTFQKDPYGSPYVPGSSLKGALRTVLLADALTRSPDSFRPQRRNVMDNNFRDRFGKKQITNAAGSLEAAAFRTLELPKVPPANALNDVLRGLRVGDSAPLGTTDLTLCQKIDVTTDGTQNKLPILRECVKPGTVLRFPLTVDPRYCPYTPERIMAAAMAFIDIYDERFLNKFQTRNILGGGNLYLGGGAGFVSKTVLYPLLQGDGLRKASEILDAQFWKHGHKKDVGKGVSPHILKCTRLGGQLYEMGACTIEID